MRGDLLWPRAYDPFAGPYTATLLGGAPPARQRRTVLYATRNHDAYHGKRLVVNESAVVAAVSAVLASTSGMALMTCWRDARWALLAWKKSESIPLSSSWLIRG